MRFIQTTCVRVCILTALALMAACSGVNFGPTSNTAVDEGPPSDNPEGGSIGPVDPGPPLVISAQQLAQELFDNTAGTMQRYNCKRLQIEGVVTKHRVPHGTEAGPMDTLGSLIFEVQVVNKRNNNQQQPYELQCNLRYLLKPENPDYALVKAGKTVTIYGQVLGSGSGSSASLNNCTIKGGQGPSQPTPTSKPPDQPPAPTKDARDLVGPVMVLDPKQFAVDLYTDKAAFEKYSSLKTLELQGVIVNRVKFDGSPIKNAKESIGAIEFVVKIPDAKKGGQIDYHIYCRFREPVPPENANFADLTVGKTAKIRGHLTGSMTGQADATLNDCVLVK